jgi:hypothetical protein
LSHTLVGLTFAWCGLDCGQLRHSCAKEFRCYLLPAQFSLGVYLSIREFVLELPLTSRRFFNERFLSSHRMDEDRVHDVQNLVPVHSQCVPLIDSFF